MTTFRFSLIIACSKLNHEEILDAAETLGEAGLTDASIRGHLQGMELLFEREADSLQSALTTAIGEVERTSFKVARVEMDREAIPVERPALATRPPTIYTCLETLLERFKYASQPRICSSSVTTVVTKS